jgi:hypothetical protein
MSQPFFKPTKIAFIPGIAAIIIFSIPCEKVAPVKVRTHTRYKPLYLGAW